MSDSSEDYFDPGIQRLKGDSNFYVWKGSVKTQRTIFNYWDITSGATPRPTFLESEASMTMHAQRAWDLCSVRAMCLISNLLSPKIRNYISLLETAPAL